MSDQKNLPSDDLEDRLGGQVFHRQRGSQPTTPSPGPVFPDDPSLEWLRELVSAWKPRSFGKNLFVTKSTPCWKLDDEELAERLQDEQKRFLLSLGWWNVPGCSSRWHVWAYDVAPAARLYFEQRDVEGLCLLAYSDDPYRARADRHFLRAFFEANGDRFDTFIMGGPPDEAEGSDYVSDELLVELLATCMEACPWYEPIPDDLAARAFKIVHGKGKAGRRELVERVGAAILGIACRGEVDDGEGAVEVFDDELEGDA